MPPGLTAVSLLYPFSFCLLLNRVDAVGAWRVRPRSRVRESLFDALAKIAFLRCFRHRDVDTPLVVLLYVEDFDEKRGEFVLSGHGLSVFGGGGGGGGGHGFPPIGRWFAA